MNRSPGVGTPEAGRSTGNRLKSLALGVAFSAGPLALGACSPGGENASTPKAPDETAAEGLVHVSPASPENPDSEVVDATVNTGPLHEYMEGLKDSGYGNLTELLESMPGAELVVMYGKPGSGADETVLAFGLNPEGELDKFTVDSSKGNQGPGGHLEFYGSPGDVNSLEATALGGDVPSTLGLKEAQVLEGIMSTQSPYEVRVINPDNPGVWVVVNDKEEATAHFQNVGDPNSDPDSLPLAGLDSEVIGEVLKGELLPGEKPER